MGAPGGHHYKERQILEEIRGHQVSKCKYCVVGGINRRDSTIWSESRGVISVCGNPQLEVHFRPSAIDG